jgi:integrase
LHREITRNVVKRGEQHRGGPLAANGALRLLSALLGFAELRGWIATNPCRGVRKNREHGREHYLRGAKLNQVLDILRSSGLVVDLLILFLLATGARKGETLAMFWSDVDLDAAIWTKRYETTKSGKRQHVPLSDEAVELLSSLPRAGVRVFHGVDASRLQRRWKVVREAVGLPQMRVHDCRHSFASLVAAQPRSSLIKLGKMLNPARRRPRVMRICSRMICARPPKRSARCSGPRAMRPSLL